ncbi:NEAT domain-containing protein [Bacillus sp. HC-Mk]
MPYGNASAKLADGTYDINYVIQKAENDSASMANDYFEKPTKFPFSGALNSVIQAL